jgi:hypothetical protein
MDNASFHKGKELHTIIEEAGIAYFICPLLLLILIALRINELMPNKSVELSMSY